MINSNYRVNLIYFLLYISLLLGFLFQEDFTLGQIKDYLIHEEKADIFKKNIINGFLKYEEYPNITHSPIYILYTIILENIFNNKILARLFNLHLSLLIPFFFYKCLQIRFQKKITDLIIFIPAIFFLSPYYRAGSIWLDDNIVALIFFILSIFFFLKFQHQKKKIIYIILNSIFLAIASYMRPIYSLFSIYFFIIFIYESKFSKEIFYYILCNFFLAAPAFYYIFILKINGWFSENLLLSNTTTIISLVSSIMFFYFSPFILGEFDKKNNYFNLSALLFSIIFFLLQIYNFNYSLLYSGGTIFRASQFFFKNNIIFYVFASASFYFIYIFLIKLYMNKNYFFDLILILILFFLEIDGIVYNETYDPLIYIISFTLIKNNAFFNYIKNFNKKKIIILFSFVIINYLSFIYKKFFI